MLLEILVLLEHLVILVLLELLALLEHLVHFVILFLEHKLIARIYLKEKERTTHQRRKRSAHKKEKE